MSDVAARLRETLREKLDPVSSDPSRGASAFRRARRGRALRGVAAGLTSVLLAGAGAVATTWERAVEDRPGPAAEPAQVATFAVDFDPGHGTVTVDVAKAQICFDLSRRVRMGAQLRYQKAGAGDVGVTATSATRSAAPQCRPVDPDHASRLLTNPAGHYAVLSPGYLTRSAGLEPLDPSPEEASGTLKIVCSQDGAVVLTPRVQPRRDGVRLRIYNQGGAWRGFEVSSPEGRLGGGGLRRGVVFDKTWTIGPGAHGIRCLRYPRADVYDPTDPGFSQFTVVDPHGLWNDPELECVEGEQRRRVATATPARDTRELPDFETLVREHVPGVEPGDVLERPRYPESAVKLEARTLIRDGRKIATLYLGTTGVSGWPDRVWSILPVACPGSGIGE